MNMYTHFMAHLNVLATRLGTRLGNIVGILSTPNQAWYNLKQMCKRETQHRLWQAGKGSWKDYLYVYETIWFLSSYLYIKLQSEEWLQGSRLFGALLVKSWPHLTSKDVIQRRPIEMGLKLNFLNFYMFNTPSVQQNQTHLTQPWTTA